MVRFVLISLLCLFLGGCRESVASDSLVAPDPSPTGEKASTSPSPAPPTWSVTLEQRYGSGAYDAGGGTSTTVTSDGVYRSRHGWMTIAGGHSRRFEGPVAYPGKLQAVEKALRDPELRTQTSQKLVARNPKGWIDDTSLTFVLDGVTTTLKVNGDGLPGAAGRVQDALRAVNGDRLTEPDLLVPANPSQVPPALRWRVTLSQKASSVESGWQSRSFWIDAVGQRYISYETAGRDDIYTYGAGPQLKPDQLAALEAAVARVPLKTPPAEAAPKPVWLQVNHVERGEVRGEPGKAPLVTVTELVNDAFYPTPLEQPWVVHPEPPPLPPEARYPDIPTGKALEKAKRDATNQLRSSAPSAGGRFPLYRLLLQKESVADDYHLLCASTPEVEQLTQGGNPKKRNRFVNQGTIGYLSGTEENGAVPVYHIGTFHRRSQVDNIYTIDPQQARRQRGYSFASILGFAFPTSVEGTIPVFSLSHGKTHLYLSDQKELESLSAQGWKSEGVAFYLYPPTRT